MYRRQVIITDYGLVSARKLCAVTKFSDGAKTNPDFNRDNSIWHRKDTYWVSWILNAHFPHTELYKSVPPLSDYGVHYSFLDICEAKMIMKVMEALRGNYFYENVEVMGLGQVHRWCCTKRNCNGLLEVRMDPSLPQPHVPYVEDGSYVEDGLRRGWARVFKSVSCSCFPNINEFDSLCGHVKGTTLDEVCKALVRTLVYEYRFPVSMYTNEAPDGFRGNADKFYIPSGKNNERIVDDHPDIMKRIQQNETFQKETHPAIHRSYYEDGELGNSNIAHFFAKNASTAKWVHIELIQVKRLNTESADHDCPSIYWTPVTFPNLRTAPTDLAEPNFLAYDDLPSLHTEKLNSILLTDAYPPRPGTSKPPNNAKRKRTGVTDGGESNLQEPKQSHDDGVENCVICLSAKAQNILLCRRDCTSAKLCHPCTMQLCLKRRPDQQMDDYNAQWWLDNRQTQYVTCPVNCEGEVKHYRNIATNQLYPLICPIFFLIHRPYFDRDELHRDAWAFDKYCAPIAKERQRFMREIHSNQLDIDHFRSDSPIQRRCVVARAQAKIKYFNVLLQETLYPDWALDSFRSKAVPRNPEYNNGFNLVKLRMSGQPGDFPPNYIDVKMDMEKEYVAGTSSWAHDNGQNPAVLHGICDNELLPILPPRTKHLQKYLENMEKEWRRKLAENDFL